MLSHAIRLSLAPPHASQRPTPDSHPSSHPRPSYPSSQDKLEELLVDMRCCVAEREQRLAAFLMNDPLLKLVSAHASLRVPVLPI